jgi:hypothetical protein
MTGLLDIRHVPLRNIGASWGDSWTQARYRLRMRQHDYEPTKGHTVDKALFQHEYVFLILAFVDICPTFVRHTDQLVTFGYRYSCLELDLTKRMVHGIAKQAFKEGASDGLLFTVVLEVESELAELLEYER